MASAPRVLGVHPGAEGKGQSNGQKKARVVKSVPVYSFRKCVASLPLCTR